MTCPRCASEDIAVRRVSSAEDNTERERICNNCHKVFKTLESITSVVIYNPNTMKSETIDYIQYTKGIASGKST